MPHCPPPPTIVSTNEAVSISVLQLPIHVLLHGMVLGAMLCSCCTLLQPWLEGQSLRTKVSEATALADLCLLHRDVHEAIQASQDT